MSDRRAFARISGLSLPSLTALTGRATTVDVIDISDGGILIETPIRVTPGEREIIVLDANATIKKPGWVERVEIIRLIPSVVYRTAIQFFAPISVRELTRTQRPVLRRAPREEMERFARWVRELSGVHAVRVSSTCRTHPHTEPVHFAVPTSRYGDGRLLQVFFAVGAVPTTAQFGQLRRMALLASDLPDLDIISSNIAESAPEKRRHQRRTIVRPGHVDRRELLLLDESTTATQMQNDGVVLIGAFPDSRFTLTRQSRKAS